LSEAPWAHGAKAAVSFVALSKIANDKIAEVKDVSRHRPHLVEERHGFLRK
jgi:hypothetical protein